MGDEVTYTNVCRWLEINQGVFVFKYIRAAGPRMLRLMLGFLGGIGVGARSVYHTGALKICDRCHPGAIASLVDRPRSISALPLYWPDWHT